MNTPEPLKKDVNRTCCEYVQNRAKTYPPAEARHIRDAVDYLTEQQPPSLWNTSTKQSIKRAYGLCRYWDAEACDMIAMLLFDRYHLGMPESEFHLLFGAEAGHVYYEQTQRHCQSAEGREEHDEKIGKQYLAFLRDTGSVVTLNENQYRNSLVWYHILTETSDKMFRRVRRQVLRSDGAHVDVLDKAYEWLSATCSRELSPSGESYMLHPIRIAAILAELGYGSEVVSAALLREPIRLGVCTVEEIRQACGTTVGDAITSTELLNTLFFEAEETASPSEGTENEKRIDAAVVARFREAVPFDEDVSAALSVQAAELLYSLRQPEIELSDPEFTRNAGYAAFEELLREYGFVHMLHLLDNYAWRVRDPKRYHRVRTAYRGMLKRNRRHADDLLAFLRGLVNGKLDGEARSDGTGGFDARIIERTYFPLEVYHLINPIDEKLRAPEERVNKHRMPLCDIDVVITPRSPVGEEKLFVMQLVRAIARESRGGEWVITRFYVTSRRRYVLEIEDAYANVFRCCIVEEETYRRDRLGGDRYPEEGSSDSRRRILVQVGDRQLMLPAGASIMDVAFKLSTEIGLSLQSATVNGRSVALTHCPKDGDTLTVDADARSLGKAFAPHVQVDWLRYVITTRAKEGLIGFLSRRI